MPTAFSISSARFEAAAFVVSACSWTASRSCLPIECTGLSEVIGSWKIIEISLPRTVRSSEGGSSSRLRPLKTASPVETVFARGFRPMIVRQVTLLPQPDSPTIASVFPFSTENDTPSTAPTMPSSVRNCVFRSRTSRSATAVSLPRPPLAQPDPRVDPRIQQVDQQVEQDHHDGGEHGHPDDLG